MKYLIPFLILSIAILTSCNLFDSSSDEETGLFGAWYAVESAENKIPAPDQRVVGWYFSDEPDSVVETLGSIFKVGVEGDTGIISLIDSRFTPSFIPQIHKITSEYIIVDHFGYGELASRTKPSRSDLLFTGDFEPDTAKDYYLTQDTVSYFVSATQLILDGHYYSGTYQRAALGSEIIDPVHSQFRVSVDGNEIENLAIAGTVPSAYISRISDDELRIVSRMGWQDISIKITGFDGPGTYTIGKGEAFYSRKGFDTLSPPYITTTDDAGVVTIESVNWDENRITGFVEFTAQMDGFDEEPEFQIEVTDGNFDLPVFE